MRLLLPCICLMLLTFSQPVAGAAREEVPYTRSQVYSAALRYLRIELRYEVTERDDEAAYLLFEYQPLGQSRRRFGAVEIVPLSSGVRLVVRLPEQPRYEEVVLRDGLVRKLRDDYGDSSGSKKAPKDAPESGKNKPSEGTVEDSEPEETAAGP